MRRLAGFLVAPLPAMLLTIIWYSLFPGPLMTASMAVAVALYLYAVQLVFGVPLAIYLHRRSMVGGAYGLAGAMMAGVPILIVVLWGKSSQSGDWELALRGPYWCAIFGALAGLTYWWIVRPERRAKEVGRAAELSSP
jgi:hypothetical protein